MEHIAGNGETGSAKDIYIPATKAKFVIHVSQNIAHMSLSNGYYSCRGTC